MQNDDVSRYRVFTQATIDKIAPLARLDSDLRLEMKAVAHVLPFRVNQYVIDHLIDWNDVPNDPMFQLTFPQPGMLSGESLGEMKALLARGAPAADVKAAANRIRLRLNPHPSGQMQQNKPRLADGTVLHGMQHKYQDTCLIFPSQGQTCHTYCTYCFRWAQFVGMEELKFAQKETATFLQYLREHPEITDVLFTGGDPMILKTKVLRKYVEPLLGEGFEHIRNIRFGTKAVAYWPQRWVTDDDADDCLRLFEEVRDAGKHLALMGHYSHPAELSTDVAREAVRRIRDAGAEVRCQAPLIRHVNDSPDVWARLWTEQVALGAIPYYMFVERNTGPKEYFEVPLARTFQVFREAINQVSGLARTVRGPSMSATPGKVQIDGVAEVNGQDVFVLSFLRGRNPDWVKRPFFAEYDEEATWFEDLVPAFGEDRFFFEDESVSRSPDGAFAAGIA